MAKKEECSNCPKAKSGGYKGEIHCAYYGRMPKYDGSACTYYDNRQCPKCGAEINTSLLVCPSCGQTLKQKPQPIENKGKEDKRTILTLLGILVLGVLATLAFAVLSNSSYSGKTNGNSDWQSQTIDDYTPQTIVEAYYQTLNAKDHVANVRLYAASDNKTEAQVQELAAIQKHDYRQLGHIEYEILSIDIAPSGETAVVKARTLYIDGSGGIETFKVKKTAHGWRFSDVTSYK